jgi:serine/threonine protein kinase
MNDDRRLGPGVATTTHEATGSERAPVAARPPVPLRIGRYRVERLLGQGGFGVVYLAHDNQLSRHVAVKVPHVHRVSCSNDVQSYLAEARILAGLDHPHIVPVYDAGSDDEFAFYIVSKYIDGADLAVRMSQSRPDFQDTARIAASVADALHYAHVHGLVHRDVKPGNILLGLDGRPFVVDFGLALRDQQVGRGPSYGGTPAYMSPEQARGEGHRVDGRSDIFSLGAVLYELLAGGGPFPARPRRS